MNVNAQIQEIATRYMNNYEYIAQTFPGDTSRYNTLVAVLKELIQRTIEAESNDQTIIR